MPTGKYIRVTIDDQPMDLTSLADADVPISYKLEDVADFQQKSSTQAFGIKFPATAANDRASNTYHNPGIEDMTSGNAFRNARKGVIEANGYELLVGKAFLRSGQHNSRPVGYQYDFYGGNADWMIDLRESTLFDFLQNIQFQFTLQAITNSWLFDGRNEALPYLFAPVRYGDPMGDADANTGLFDDKNMKPEYMRPSLSKYWIIYWAFKSLGYRVQSTFFDTDFFRRQVMPWTWGNFLYSEGTRLDALKFLAKGTQTVSIVHQSVEGYIDMVVSNDTTNGGFDNNNAYQYDTAAKEGRWTYLNAFNYGRLEANFAISLFITATATAGSTARVWVVWFKNGVQLQQTQLLSLNAPNIGRKDFAGLKDDYLTVSVAAGDVISFKVLVHTTDTSLGRVLLSVNADEFSLQYFKVRLGSTIDFKNYTGLKKYKFLDMLRGVIDESNLLVGTDSVNKVVYFEPAHAYAVDNNALQTTPGYFTGDYEDWSMKQDLSDSKLSEVDSFSDSERELIFKYKEDSSDGMLKTIQDRNTVKVGQGKYVLPDRFQEGHKDAVENRFFSPVVHYDVEQWKYITGDAPQMICMIPENVSNTSRDEAQNTFGPKSAYYKGMIAGMGWVFNGAEMSSFPLMFAVNYKTGGENDPILSYGDERIGPAGGTQVVGKGLLRRFYLQRMANMRNGQNYTTFFRLNNIDVANFLHREHIICRGQRWELIEIKEFRPLSEESTTCVLRRHTPVVAADDAAIFPVATTVLDTAPVTNAFDIKYQPLKCLTSDIPK